MQAQQCHFIDSTKRMFGTWWFKTHVPFCDTNNTSQTVFTESLILLLRAGHFHIPYCKTSMGSERSLHRLYTKSFWNLVNQDTVFLLWYKTEHQKAFSDSFVLVFRAGYLFFPNRSLPAQKCHLLYSTKKVFVIWWMKTQVSFCDMTSQRILIDSFFLVFSTGYLFVCVKPQCSQKCHFLDSTKRVWIKTHVPFCDMK